jgi:hypothetical protein
MFISSINKKIDWIKTWVQRGGDTPFHDIQWLMHHATTQALVNIQTMCAGANRKVKLFSVSRALK